MISSSVSSHNLAIHAKFKMTTPQLKRQRSSVKGRFTRAENILTDKLDDEEVCIEVILSIYDDVKDAWKNVNEKHDVYVASIEGEDGEDTQSEEVQNKFYEIQTLVNTFQIKNKNRHILENAKRSRDVSYSNFRQLCLNVQKTISLQSSTESIERERSEIQIQFSDVRSKHNELSLLLEDEELKVEEEWLSRLVNELSVANNAIDEYVQKLKIKGKSVKRNIQLEIYRYLNLKVIS